MSTRFNFCIVSNSVSTISLVQSKCGIHLENYDWSLSILVNDRPEKLTTNHLETEISMRSVGKSFISLLAGFHFLIELFEVYTDQFGRKGTIIAWG